MTDDDRIARLEVAVRDAQEQGRAAMDAAQGATSALNNHEQICALRYEGIAEKLDDGKDRFRRLEILILIAVAAAAGGGAVIEQIAPLLRAAGGAG